MGGQGSEVGSINFVSQFEVLAYAHTTFLPKVGTHRHININYSTNYVGGQKCINHTSKQEGQNHLPKTKANCALYPSVI